MMLAMDENVTTHDLIVIGATAGGLSVAEGAKRAGLERVVLLERGHSVLMPEIISRNDLLITYGERVQRVDYDPETDMVEVVTDRQIRRAAACMIAEREYPAHAEPPIEVPESGRVTVDHPPSIAQGADIMVVGATDHAVEVTAQLASAGANVVLAADGLEPVRLSPVAGEMLAKLERERQATVLYRSSPTVIGERDGFPLAYFADRHTPDLEFDHVVFASSRAPADTDSLGVTDAARHSDAVWIFEGAAEETGMNGAFGPDLWRAMAAVRFPEITVESYGVSRGAATPHSRPSWPSTSTTPRSPCSSRPTAICGDSGFAPTWVTPATSPVNTPPLGSATGSRVSTRRPTTASTASGSR